MTRTGVRTSVLLCTGLGCAAGLGIGWLDLHTTEVVVTIVPLLVAGGVLGCLEPKGAWRWAALLALGVVVMAVLARAAGLATAEPVRLDPRIWLVVFAFAAAGAYGGVLLRRGVASLGP